eukprot:scaffold135284_cov28-Prasinocladus_malaysianus.AAC.1
MTAGSASATWGVDRQSLSSTSLLMMSAAASAASPPSGCWARLRSGPRAPPLQRYCRQLGDPATPWSLRTAA